MSMKPVLGAALHLLQYLSKAALVKASAYSSTLPVFKLALYKRSAIRETRSEPLIKDHICAFILNSNKDSRRIS